MMSLLCDEALYSIFPSSQEVNLDRGKPHCLYPERGGLPLPSVCLCPRGSLLLCP